MYTPDDTNFFYCLSSDKQDEIKQKYAAAVINNDKDKVALYEDFYGKDILTLDNPYIVFVA